jgi:hypothetical protein
MSQHYSDPSRENDPHALPDIEVFEASIVHIECRCGDYDIAEGESFEDITCPSCDRKPESAGFVSNADGTPKTGWFWWTCFPGCLPEGWPNGPFDTEEEALADAQEGNE